MLHEVRALVVVLLGVALVPSAGASMSRPSEPHVVVAVADTGVNPYHEVYYRPQNTAHPCTWVEGFDDCSVPALELSVGKYADWRTAFAADAEIWASVRLRQWYWIPRTNIIGAVCDGTSALGSPVGTCILDDDTAGHGTGTTSSVLTEVPEALLLVHEGNAGASALATAPVVPDIQSHSWGPPAPLPLHAAEPVIPGEQGVCRDAFDPETIFFIAAGNEAPLPAIADCTRVRSRVQIVGGGFPGHWETSSWSTADFTSWHCRPVALHRSTTRWADNCGTSFAGPTAAGAAAAALLRVRQAEGYVGRNTPGMVSATVSREQFIDALRRAATYEPRSKFPNRPRERSVPLPPEAPYLFWGYGWLDSTVSEAIAACALGGPCAPKSAAAQEHNARRQAIRSATSEDVVATPQDDAGSGRDAGDRLRTAVPIEPGASYDARLTPVASLADREDWFAFSAPAGRHLSVDVAGTAVTWYVVDPNGKQLQSSSALALDPLLPADPRASGIATTVDGTYVLRFTSATVPQDYRFRLRLDDPPAGP